MAGGLGLVANPEENNALGDAIPITMYPIVQRKERLSPQIEMGMLPAAPDLCELYILQGSSQMLAEVPNIQNTGHFSGFCTFLYVINM